MAWLTFIARKDTRAFYEAFSRDYDALVGGQPNARPIGQFLAEYLQEQNLFADRVLDLGCGTGLYSRELVASTQRLFGVDFSLAQLLEARRVPIKLAQADVLALPFKGSSFDVVTSYQVLPHLPGCEGGFVGEAFRVLRPGGVFLLDPAASLAERRPAGARFGQLVRLTLLRATRIGAWTRMPTREELVGHLQRAGFKTELHDRVYEKPWTFLIGRKP